jgi:hypothetical protein
MSRPKHYQLIKKSELAALRLALDRAEMVDQYAGLLATAQTYSERNQLVVKLAVASGEYKEARNATLPSKFLT